MIPFRDIVIDCGGWFQFFALLPLILQIYAVIEAWYLGRRTAVRVYCTVMFVLGLLLFSALLDTTYTVSYADRLRGYPFFVEMLYAMPWLAIAVTELLLAALAILSAVGMRRYRRSHLSRAAIKETLDMLPVGICFAQSDGTVMLTNLRMDRLCREITGRALNDALLFRRAVCDAGELRGDTIFCSLSDGSAIQFSQESIELDGQEYVLAVASDISEQYRITADLKAKNKKLLDIRLRMRAFGEETASLAMSEEILRARVTVHDEVGHILLSGKYLLENPSADAERFLTMAKYTNRLLTREGELPDDAHMDLCTAAVDLAMAMGVTVSITGELPAEESKRAILGRAIRESSANTVRHAGGDHLDVTLTRDGDRIRAVLCGNGAVPDQPVVEAGGLHLLRLSVEEAGGVMQITSSPRVALTIVL